MGQARRARTVRSGPFSVMRRGSVVGVERVVDAARVLRRRVVVRVAVDQVGQVDVVAVQRVELARGVGRRARHQADRAQQAVATGGVGDRAATLVAELAVVRDVVLAGVAVVAVVAGVGASVALVVVVAVVVLVVALRAALVILVVRAPAVVLAAGKSQRRERKDTCGRRGDDDSSLLQHCALLGGREADRVGLIEVGVSPGRFWPTAKKATGRRIPATNHLPPSSEATTVDAGYAYVRGTRPPFYSIRPMPYPDAA